jgi:hypothetical protein
MNIRRQLGVTETGKDLVKYPIAEIERILAQYAKPDVTA